MLFGALLLSVVRDVELHELVEASEAVAEGGVFNALLVGYDKVVKRQKRLDAVDQEVTVARD